MENLGLSYHTAPELNAKIDAKLPGRPIWIHGEVDVCGQIVDVYYRDVVLCIKALFGNPQFARYLLFLPEKHFADAGKTKPVYHDMHTGSWWWAMQVYFLCAYYAYNGVLIKCTSAGT